MVPVKLTKGKLDTIRGRILSTTIVQTAEKAIEEENENIAERLNWSDITFSNTYTEDLVEFEETLCELKAGKYSGREFVTANDKGIILGIYKTSYIAGLTRLYQTSLLYYSMPDGAIKVFEIRSDETCSFKVEGNEEEELVKIIYHGEDYNIVSELDDENFVPVYEALYQKLLELVTPDTVEAREKVLNYIRNNVVLECVDDSQLKQPYAHVSPINAWVLQNDPDEPIIFDIFFILTDHSSKDFSSYGWEGTANVVYLDITVTDLGIYCRTRYIPTTTEAITSIHFE